jgi:ATP-dependent RNA helicase RhlE
LVLAPTRELAAQISASFRVYGKFAQISVATIVGGVGHVPQIKALARGLDVLVATPGRLIDHLSSGNLRLDATEIIVLDEADHMLDLGFIQPIRQILSCLPDARQSLFFSATMPKEIAGLAAEILSDPVEVKVTPVSTTAERVAQEVYLIESAGKRELLYELVQQPEFARTIVFTRTKRGADRVAEFLEAGGVAAAAIHGNKSQNQRQRALDGFRHGHTRVLVATDIAARGIDIDGVTHVVNFELPEVPEAYVHRIGRTARAGAAGAAVSFCDETERGLLRAIEKLTRQKLPVIDRCTKGDGHVHGERGGPEAHHRDKARFDKRRGAGNAHAHGHAHVHHHDGRGAGPQHGKPGANSGSHGLRNGRRNGRAASSDRAARGPQVTA